MDAFAVSTVPSFPSVYVPLRSSGGLFRRPKGCHFRRKISQKAVALPRCHRMESVPSWPVLNGGELKKNEVEMEEEFMAGEAAEASEEERKTVERLLEEALMGCDQGKEATDYYRRAYIFQKSSQLFHAIKNDHSAHQSPSQAS